MGGSRYSNDDYAARSFLRSDIAAKKGISIDAATFGYDHDVKAGRASGVHASLNPHGVKMRESRDSDAHPVTVPIIIVTDTTGSMQQVPKMLQKSLSRLMGRFLDDKASGKRYLGDGYPAIMIAAVDDYAAQRQVGHKDGAGTLQVGQFESGLEIDDNLTNLWMTGNGGGTYSESYELALYFAARKTAHDHMEKRGRKGYLFVIGDEHAYQAVSREAISAVIGDTAQDDIPLKEIIAAASQKYYVFFVIPNMTSHYGDRALEKYWVELLGQQNVLKLEDPDKICELIAGAVAICEENIGIEDLCGDMGATLNALVPLAKSGAGAISSYSAAGLVAAGSGVERL